MADTLNRMYQEGLIDKVLKQKPETVVRSVGYLGKSFQAEGIASVNGHTVNGNSN